MSQTGNAPKARVLILSHCLPLANGSVEQQRAATLLGMVASPNLVSLACISHEQVRFAEWSQPHGQCDQFVIHRPCLLDRRVASFGHRWDATAAKSKLFERTLGQTVDVWLQNQSFDAVLLTHPAFWSIARRIRSRMRIIDFHSIADELSGAAPQGGLSAVLHERQREQWISFSRYVAKRCSINIVDGHQTAHSIASVCRSVQIISQPPEPLQIERVRNMVAQHLACMDSEISESSASIPFRRAA